LRYLGTALQGFYRVLALSGRLILFEPAASWFGRFVYHFLHHEPVAIQDPITWDAPAGFSAADVDYYAAQSSATRLFWWGEGHDRLAGWRFREVRPVTSFSHFASGGFSGPQFGGRFLHSLMRGLDFVASALPRVCAGRLLVVLKKGKT